MLKFLPSQLVEAIDSLFGPNRTELDGRAVTHVYRAEVHALLALLDDVPRELIDLRSGDYLEFTRCRAVLATSLVRWNLGDITPARDVGGKDSVERIRRLMKQCDDELPPAEPELPFISDADWRDDIDCRFPYWVDLEPPEDGFSEAVEDQIARFLEPLVGTYDLYIDLRGEELVMRYCFARKQAAAAFHAAFAGAAAKSRFKIAG
jgi:hypothetical protein